LGLATPLVSGPSLLKLLIYNVSVEADVDVSVNVQHRRQHQREPGIGSQILSSLPCALGQPPNPRLWTGGRFLSINLAD
jgi:hypothetical protein